MNKFPDARYWLRWVSLVVTAAFCMSCASNNSNSGLKNRSFEFSYLAKADVDLVSELHQRATLDYIKELADKLYKRNPREWKKSGYLSSQSAIDNIFDRDGFPEPRGKRGIDSIRLAFDEAYSNDRVLAFAAGLATMLIDSYNGKTEFYFYDTLNAQKLYNCARNTEVAGWLLRSRRNSEGRLFLLSSGNGDTQNLSFERLFGKIIAQQDSIAQITANKTNRHIKNVIRSVAMVFLPI